MNEEKSEKIKNGKHVYVLENSDGDIKIGVSKSIDVRKRTIENQTGKMIINVFTTDLCSNSYSIERELHKHYQSKKIYGEWFHVSYQEAVDLIKEIFNKRAKFDKSKPSDTWRLFEYFHPKGIYEANMEFNFQINLSSEKFKPLIGCILTGVSEGAEEDGTEVITLKFVSPAIYKYIRVSFSENGDVSVTEFEDQ